MKLNKKPEKVYTHEGGRASRISPLEELKRAVLSCLLWEYQFYENGESIAERIHKLAHKCKPQKVADLAIEARQKHNLRHAPLWLTLALLNHPNKYLLGGRLKYIVARVIQRADELTEILAMYWKDGKKPIPAQLKYGLALAFKQFNEYQLAKYNRKNAIKLKDVLMLTHPKPDTKEQSTLWERLLTDNLKTPDTWETALSSGGDKKEHWERLIKENKLGALARLRNIRGMIENDVDPALVKQSITGIKTNKILPFRFITAARHAPSYEPEIEMAMLNCLSDYPKIPGQTALLIDMSASMTSGLSGKSELNRIDAACALAILLREICEDVRIYSFSMKLCEIPARHGFALKDAIKNSQQMSGTPLGLAIESIYAPQSLHTTIDDFGWPYGKYQVDYRGQNLKPDRLIIFTDEQSHDNVKAPKSKAYMINVASSQQGVGYGQYHHINGFSEAVIKYIQEYERQVLA